MNEQEPKLASELFFDKTYLKPKRLSDLGTIIGHEQLVLDAIKLAQDIFPSDFLNCDPNAGDGLCQHRSLLTLLLSKRADLKKILHDVNLDKAKKSLQKFEKVVKNAEGNFSEYKKLHATLKKTKITNLLDGYPLFDDTITESQMDDIRYILLVSFLSHQYDDLPSKQKEKLAKLKKNYGIPKKPATILIHSSRKWLNQKAISFFDKEIVDATDEILKRALQQRETEYGLTLIPTYFAKGALIKYLFKNNIPIVLQSTVICLDHKHTHQVHHIIKGSEKLLPEAIDPNEGIIVIDGMTDLTNRLSEAHYFDLKEKLLDSIPEGDSSCEGIKTAKEGIEHFGLRQIVLANVAAHKQYMDPTHEFDFSVLNEETREEFLRNKKIGLEEGMSMENAKIFRILHINPARAKSLFGRE